MKNRLVFIGSYTQPIVLGTGELTKALTVVASQFTEGAKRKIEAAGGRCEEASA